MLGVMREDGIEDESSWVLRSRQVAERRPMGVRGVRGGPPSCGLAVVRK